MKKLERRLAYYENGKIEVGKTNRKTFKTEGLVGVVAFYDDGTREEEPIELKRTISPDDRQAYIQLLRMKAHQEYKSDGGDTLEIKEMTRKED